MPALAVKRLSKSGGLHQGKHGCDVADVINDPAETGYCKKLGYLLLLRIIY
jgi:hypothetical protein